jgi:hypothetical protein
MDWIEERKGIVSYFDSPSLSSCAHFMNELLLHLFLNV